MRLKSLLCSGLFFLRIRVPDCEHCSNPQDCPGSDLRKRLEELREHEQAPRRTMPSPPTSPLRIETMATPPSEVSSNQDVSQDRYLKTG